MIFWINIPMGLAALAISTIVLRRLPRHERPHRLDISGAILIVWIAYSMLTTSVILALVALAVTPVMFIATTWLSGQARNAPEPLIPISILTHPIVRCAITTNTFGWGAIIGLNIMLPIYLQSAMGLSATQAGLSLVAFMVALNTSAGLAGQVLGRVRHYKLLPMIGLTISMLAVASLAWRTGDMTPLRLELTLILIGAGFGPLPSLSSVAMQNVVARHQLGISVGTMNFSRNLYATMLIAVFGAIVLAGMPAGESLRGAAAAVAGNVTEAFRLVFMLAAASMLIALASMVLMTEKPLQSGAELDAG